MQADPALPQISGPLAHRAEYLRLLVETYRHHFDLFMKSWILYFAVIGGVGGYLGQSGLRAEVRMLASAVMVVASLVGVQRCQPIYDWVVDLESTLRTLTTELALPPISLSGARSAVRTVQYGCITMAIVGSALVAITASPV